MYTVLLMSELSGYSGTQSREPKSRAKNFASGSRYKRSIKIMPPTTDTNTPKVSICTLAGLIFTEGPGQGLDKNIR